MIAACLGRDLRRGNAVTRLLGTCGCLKCEFNSAQAEKMADTSLRSQ
jgi:hypothetical protein